MKFIKCSLIVSMFFSQVILAGDPPVRSYEICEVSQLIYKDKKMDGAILLCSARKGTWELSSAGLGLAETKVVMGILAQPKPQTDKECETPKSNEPRDIIPAKIYQTAKAEYNTAATALAMVQGTCHFDQKSEIINGISDSLSLYFMGLKDELIFNNVKIEGTSLVEASLSRTTERFRLKDSQPISVVSVAAADDQTGEEATCQARIQDMTQFSRQVSSRIAFFTAKKQSCEGGTWIADNLSDAPVPVETPSTQGVPQAIP